MLQVPGLRAESSGRGRGGGEGGAGDRAGSRAEGTEGGGCRAGIIGAVHASARLPKFIDCGS